MATSLSTAGPRVTHDSLGPFEPSTQTASRSVQPFLQGSLVLVWQTDGQTDRPTDHATRSVTIGRIYICSIYRYIPVLRCGLIIIIIIIIIITGVGAAEKSGTHADLVGPADRVDTYVAGHERRVEEMIAFNVLVRVASELLITRRKHHPRYRRHRHCEKRYGIKLQLKILYMCLVFGILNSR